MNYTSEYPPVLKDTTWLLKNDIGTKSYHWSF